MVNKFLFPNGGSETYIFKLGECLAKQGHQIEYFGMDEENRCVSNSANSYTSNMDFHNGSKLKKITYPIKTIYSTEARKKIRLVLNKFRPDAVHLNNFTYQLTPSIILEINKWKKETNSNCKIIYTAHDYNLICPNHMLNNPNTHENCELCIGGKFINCTKNKCIHSSLAKSLVGTAEATFWKMQGTYKYIDKIICCSEFMKKKLDTNPLFRNKTIAMHNFVEQKQYLTVEKKDYVLYFGRYSEEKGINTLLKVCKELPKIDFIFAGSGPLEKDVNSVQNVKNVGFKTGNELEKLVREAKFTICPSEVYENCPFSVMESQMYGTPVIGADIGGIPEIIENGKTGELFESGNISDLQSKVLNLWNDDEKLTTYIKNCKDVHFDTTEEYVEKLIKYYM